MSIFQLRPLVPADKAFITASWLKGQRFGHPFFEATEPTAYYAYYAKLIENLLALPTTTVIVCCLSDEPDVIVGYSVHTGPEVLNWVFVKSAWRKQGIGKMLVRAEVKTVTSITRPGLAIAKKRGYKFNPFY